MTYNLGVCLEDYVKSTFSFDCSSINRLDISIEAHIANLVSNFFRRYFFTGEADYTFFLLQINRNVFNTNSA